MHSNPDHIVFTKQSYERMYIWLINRVRKEKHNYWGEELLTISAHGYISQILPLLFLVVVIEAVGLNWGNVEMMSLHCICNFFSVVSL